jgi:hypothetical protein
MGVRMSVSREPVHFVGGGMKTGFDAGKDWTEAMNSFNANKLE